MQQHVEALSAALGHREVRLSIAVEVADRNPIRGIPGIVIGRCDGTPEGPIALANQGADRSPDVATVHQNVGHAVAGYIASQQDDEPTQRLERLGIEASIAIAEHDHQVSAGTGDEVGLAIEVQVGGGECVGVDGGRGERGSDERAIPVSPENADVGIPGRAIQVRESDVLLSIAVEIGDDRIPADHTEHDRVAEADRSRGAGVSHK